MSLLWERAVPAMEYFRACCRLDSVLNLIAGGARSHRGANTFAG